MYQTQASTLPLYAEVRMTEGLVGTQVPCVIMSMPVYVHVIGLQYTSSDQIRKLQSPIDRKYLLKAGLRSMYRTGP